MKLIPLLFFLTGCSSLHNCKVYPSVDPSSIMSGQIIHDPVGNTQLILSCNF